MHFSVIKEVGWEADDEREDAKPRLGVKKRYRFILDFSRRSLKDSGNSKRTGPGPGPSEHYAESDEEDDNFDSYRHSCYCCGAIRSDQYHEEHPLRCNKPPRPSLCTQCRFYRGRRLASRARDGSRRHHVTKTEAQTDEREWCGGCGTLRSNKYHVKLVSGEPSSDVCGHCIIAAERKKRLGRLRVDREELGMADESDSEKHDPLGHSLLQRRRSSPYAFTPTFSREESEAVSPTTSTSSFKTQVNQSDELSRDEQSPAASTAAETPPPAYGGSKTSETASADIRKTTVENHESEDDHEHVYFERQVRQETQEAQPLRHHLHQEKRHGLPQQPELKPRGNSPTPVSGPASAPQLATSDHTKQRQECREPQPKSKAQTHERPKSAAAAPTSIELAPGATETRDYFRPRNMKRPEPREQPTMMAPAPAPVHSTSDNTNQREQKTHETHGCHHGHRKQLSTSSAEPPRAQEEPFYFRNPNPTGKSEPRAQAKPKQEPVPQPSRPMGVSDMYWASAAGQAETEQTFTAGGLFVSAGMCDAFAAAPAPGSGSRGGLDNHRHSHQERAEKRERRGFSSSSSSSRHKSRENSHGHAAQVWEVDSDEAEEIEQERVRLIKGVRTKGKARGA